MQRRPLLALAGALCAALPLAGAQAQDFPAKPLRIIVPWNAGTATDTAARLLGQRITEITKQPVVVDNKPGAGGTIGSQEVARAAPDGYTLLVTSNAHIANQFLIRNVPYDAVRDFTPIAMIQHVPLVLVANPKLGVRTVEELTQMARRSPGKLSFAAGSSGGRVGMELYRQLAGIDLLHVPYKSNTLAMTDLIGGQVDVMVVDVGLAYPQLQAGKITGLATTGPRRASSLPALPTMAEAGVAGYELTGWGAIWAPAGVPAPIVARLNALFVEALRDPRIQELAAKASGEIAPVGAAEFARFQSADVERWRSVTQAAKIQPE